MVSCVSQKRQSAGVGTQNSAAQRPVKDRALSGLSAVPKRPFCEQRRHEIQTDHLFSQLGSTSDTSSLERLKNRSSPIRMSVPLGFGFVVFAHSQYQHAVHL